MTYARMLTGFVAALFLGASAAALEPTRANREQLHRDTMGIAVQQICPISGQRLGQHGPPIKVTVGKNRQEIFVCCKGCLQKRIDPKHWNSIHLNYAKAQRICPIMKKELPANPTLTIVAGRAVYVCCPPCTKKLSADPRYHLRKIDELYAAAIKRRRLP